MKQEHFWVGKLVNVMILRRESWERLISNIFWTTATSPLGLWEPPILEETRQLYAHEEMGESGLLIEEYLKYQPISVLPPKSLAACSSMVCACFWWHPWLNPHWFESQILPLVFKSSYDAFIPGYIMFSVTKTSFIGKIRTIIKSFIESNTNLTTFYHSFNMQKIPKQTNKHMFACLSITRFLDEIFICNIHCPGEIIYVRGLLKVY